MPFGRAADATSEPVRSYGANLLAQIVDQMAVERFGILLNPLDDGDFAEVIAGFFRLDPLVPLDLFDLALDELMIGHNCISPYYLPVNHHK